MSTAVDLDQRDPHDINQHLKTQFEDVLAEPIGTHSFDCVWLASFMAFNCGKKCCYKLMTVQCGVCIALFWGCEFAFITFDQVWCFTPMLRILSIYVGCCQRYYGTIIQCCLAPVCETMGLCLSKIVINKSS